MHLSFMSRLGNVSISNSGKHGVPVFLILKLVIKLVQSHLWHLQALYLRKNNLPALVAIYSSFYCSLEIAISTWCIRLQAKYIFAPSNTWNEKKLEACVLFVLHQCIIRFNLCIPRSLATKNALDILSCWPASCRLQNSTWWPNLQNVLTTCSGELVTSFEQLGYSPYLVRVYQHSKREENIMHVAAFNFHKSVQPHFQETFSHEGINHWSPSSWLRQTRQLCWAYPGTCVARHVRLQHESFQICSAVWNWGAQLNNLIKAYAKEGYYFSGLPFTWKMLPAPVGLPYLVESCTEPVFLQDLKK